jgi:hypothetical protein
MPTKRPLKSWRPSLIMGVNLTINFSRMNGSDIAEHIRVLADAGFQGLAELHENRQTPFKKSKSLPLTVKEKRKNRALARKRVLIEHIFRKLKMFRILSER